MIVAILVCGLGYAEGAKLSRRLGGWQVISWSLLLSLPMMAVITLFTLPSAWSNIGVSAWIGLAYVSIFSKLVGFIFWYRGLSLGGIGGRRPAAEAGARLATSAISFGDGLNFAKN